MAVSAPAAFSVESFTAATTQSPPNPVPEGTLVTYTTSHERERRVVSVRMDAPRGPRSDRGDVPRALGTHRAPPNNYTSVTPSQGTCAPQATTPPSVDCTLGSLAPGASATYVSMIEATVSMANLVAVLRAGPTVLADVDTIVTPSCVVPSVVGRLLASARKLLAKANCGVGAVTRKRAGKRRRGRVVSQRPAAGTRLANGAPVAIVVGKR